MKHYSINSLLSSFLLSIPLIISFSHTKGSPDAIDSLTTVLINKQGTNRIDDLLQLSKLLQTTKPQKALEYAYEGMELARQSNLKEKEADFHLCIGDAQGLVGNHKEAEKHLLVAAQYFRTNNQIDKLITSWDILAYLFTLSAEYDQSRKYYYKLIKIHEGLDDRIKVARANGSIGSAYYMQGDYTNALRYHDKAIKIFEEEGLQVDLGAANTTKATILGNMGKPMEALNLLMDQAILFEQEGSDKKLAVVNHHIGYMLQNFNLFDEALEYYSRAIAHYESIDATFHKSSVLANFGQIAMAKNNFSEAEEYLKQAQAIDRENGRESSPDLYSYFAELYCFMDKYDIALSNAKKAFHLFQEQEDSKGIIEARINLARIYIGTNQLTVAENQLNLSSSEPGFDDLSKIALTANELYIQLYRKQDDYKKMALYQGIVDSIEADIFSTEKAQGINKRLIQEKIRKEKEETLFWKNEALSKDSEIVHLESKQNHLQYRYYLVIMGLLATGAIFLYRKSKIKKRQISIEEELSISQLQQSDLQDQLNKSKEEINQLSVNLVRKNQALKDLKNNLHKIANTAASKKTVDDLMHRLQLDEMLQADWDYFQDLFIERFPDFFITLKSEHPILSQKDLRLCGLIRSRISPQEVSDILGISTESVHSARYRLRKKLNLDKKTDLDQFLMNI